MILPETLPIQIPVAIPGLLDDLVTVRQWKTGDPFPELSPLVAVDTETELITDSVLFPPLVVTGVYDPDHKTSWLISYEDSNAFMRELCRRDIKQVYFNLGFDQGVLNKADPELQPLLAAIDSNRVVDMQIRAHLYQIATTGYVFHNTYSLKGCCEMYLKIHLDKGDGTESSARLSFRRDTPITQEQARYLPMDCIATWALSQRIPPQATEEDATKGMCVLADISANGFRVDRRVHAKFVSRLNECKEVYAKDLRAFGYPLKGESSKVDAVTRLRSALDKLTHSELSGDFTPNKTLIRRLLVYMYNHDAEPDEATLMCTELNMLRAHPSGGMSKAETALWQQMMDEFCLERIDESRKKDPMLLLCAETAERLAAQTDVDSAGYDVTSALTDAVAVITDNGGPLYDVKPVGPRKFFLQYVTDVLKAQCPGGPDEADKQMSAWEATLPGTPSPADWMQQLISLSKLKLDITPTSGDPKLTKKDAWRLEDIGVSDKFLTAYVNYNHCNKYLSTYMKEDFIKSDGKVHPKFTNLLRTGRTSCTGPNLQNLPSHDPTFKLKLMYMADPGYILCATDFSFIELCAFGQACYTRFKDTPELRDVEGSVMRLVINAGLDPHRWFAGVMYGKISPDLSRRNDPAWVADLNAHLKQVVTKEERQSAKMANFGLPGGLSEKSYYKHCREGGLNCTYAEAKKARDSWLSTFREMQLHTSRLTPMPVPTPVSVQYGLAGNMFGAGDDEEEDELYEAEQQAAKKTYLARTITGMVRAEASANSAMNIQFQGLVAQGAKLAGWNMVKSGYGKRLLNFVHDEYLYQLRPEELDDHIPVIEQLMLDGMRKVIPDVKIGVETSCCIHWDKEATEFSKLPKDATGGVMVSDAAVEELLK